MNPLPLGTLTFLFTDIEGSTRLWENQREAMQSALARHDAILRDCIERNGGFVVKTTGDGFHAVFTRAPHALRASLDAQKSLHSEPWPSALRIRVRMALHTGEAEFRDADYYGPSVNRAARLVGLGHGGQTLLSEVTHNLCRDLVAPEITFKRLGEHALKDLSRAEAVFELRHPDLPQTFPPLQALLAPIDSETPSIAVLPFADLSADKDQEYFADGLAEELLNVLSKIRGVRVASRTSAFSFKGSSVDLPTIARKLNVATVLEGSVRKSGKRVRIRTQLVQVATDSHLWSQTYDRELDDIFAVQDDIAQAVVKELRTALLHTLQGPTVSAQVAAEVREAARGRSEHAEGYQLYLQARFLADRLNREDTARAIDYYDKALALDAGHALAWAWLARAYADQAAYAWAPYAESFEKARAAAQRALVLEPDLAEGHAALGFVRMANDRDWDGAAASFRRALELAPGNSLVLRIAAVVAACMGRHEESVALLRRAVTLDPLSVPAQRVLGLRCLFVGLLDEAQVALDKALELNPDSEFTRYWLAMLLLARGHFVDARAMILREPNEVLRMLGLTVVEHAAGNDAEANLALKELVEAHADRGAFQIASAYACLGDADLAFAWLERADAQRDPGIVEIKAEMLMRGIHGDSRWPPFLKRLGTTGSGEPSCEARGVRARGIELLDARRRGQQIGGVRHQRRCDRAGCGVSVRRRPEPDRRSALGERERALQECPDVSRRPRTCPGDVAGDALLEGTRLVPLDPVRHRLRHIANEEPGRLECDQRKFSPRMRANWVPMLFSGSLDTNAMALVCSPKPIST